MNIKQRPIHMKKRVTLLQSHHRRQEILRNRGKLQSLEVSINDYSIIKSTLFHL